ncbi:endonuclease III [bacterium]|nr:endonuclease III [bacterium]
MTEKERKATLVKAVKAAYPKAGCSLKHRGVWQLLCATILSAQCTDERVNLTTPSLFKAYPSPKDLGNAGQEDVEKLIRSCGFYKNKAKSLIAASKIIAEKFKGRVPKTMEELTALPGVARKTANVVLGTGYGINDGIVVDTHVSRLSNRLGLTKNTEPEKIEKDLMRIVPREEWTDFSHQLIAHGRAVCQARAPKCAECPFSSFCPSAL